MVTVARLRTMPGDSESADSEACAVTVDLGPLLNHATLDPGPARAAPGDSDQERGPESRRA
jgi:hypothetical protein